MITSVLSGENSIPVSSDFMAKVNNGETPYVRMQFIPAVGNPFWIEDGQFWGNTINFSEATSNEGAFEVGGAVIGAFNFSLNNFDRTFDNVDFAGAAVVPLIYYTINNVRQYLAKGIYYINSHRTSGNVIQCTALDGLKLMDKSQTAITYPITVQDLIETICDANNITLATEEIDNGGFEITTAPNSDVALTDRQMLSYACQITGNFARMNEDGELVVGWYDFENTSTVRSTFNGKTLWTSPIEVTGIQAIFEKDGESKSVLYGTDDYVIRIEGNPFVSDSNATSVCQMVGAKIFGKAFRPGTIPILSNPCLQAGDVLEITDNITGDTYLFPITSLTYTKSITETLNCAMEDKEDADLRVSSYSMKVSVAEAMRQALQADAAAQAAQDMATVSGYQYVILSDKGTVLTEDGDVVLTAVIYDSEMNEVDAEGTDYVYRWWVMQDSNAKAYLGGGKELTVYVGDALCDYAASIFFETMESSYGINPFKLYGRCRSSYVLLANRAGTPLTSRYAESVDT